MLLLFSSLSLLLTPHVYGQEGANDKRRPMPVRLCTRSYEEFNLCERLVKALHDDPVTNKGVDVSTFKEALFAVNLECARGNTLQQCFDMIGPDIPAMVKVPAQELYGVHSVELYNDYVPIAAGRTVQHCTDDCHKYARDYAVAVVSSKNEAIKTVNDLRKGVKACFGKPGDVSGWVIPVYALSMNFTSVGGKQAENIRRKRERTDYCKTDFDDISQLFQSACVPGDWSKDQEWSDRYGAKLCGACKDSRCPLGEVPAEFCLEALEMGLVDVAFTDSLTVDKFFMIPGSTETRNNKGDYSLLCKSGRKSNVFEHLFCHIGVIPEYTYVTTLRNDRKGASIQTTQLIAAFLQTLFAHIQNNSPGRYSSDLVNLIGDVETIKIDRLDETYSTLEQPFTQHYIVEEGGPYFYGALEHSRPICEKASKIRLCVQSQAEYKKCLAMESEWSAAGLHGGGLECVIGQSEAGCVNLLNRSEADLSVMSSHRADHAIHDKGLVPILEVEEDVALPTYAIAATLTRNTVTKLNEIKDLTSSLSVCSSGTDSFAGWEAPNHMMKSLGIIGKHNCLLTEAWNKLFTSGCVPGAPNAEVTLGRNQSQPIDIRKVENLCSQCTRGSGGACQTPGMTKSTGQVEEIDLYYGDIGALRCLLRGKGNIAFMRNTGIDSLDLLRSLDDPDVRNLQPLHGYKDYPTDFLLLCPDGKSNLPYSKENVKKCNLGKTPEKWVVARGSASKALLSAWQDRLLQAGNRARRFDDWFKTFPNTRKRQSVHLLDLIFSNATIGFKRFDIAVDRDHRETHASLYDHWDDPFTCGALKVLASIWLLSVVTVVVACFQT